MIAGALVVSGCALIQPSGNPHVPAPARTVDLARYVGVWYEMARYDSNFEHGCERVTAHYAARADGLIDVINACHRGGVDGPLAVARGRAYVVAGSGNARLRVSFFGPFFIGSYWVLDHADDYSWSIVGEGSGGYLWMLTRAPHPAPAMTHMLVERVAALGYDIARLRFTQQ